MYCKNCKHPVTLNHEYCPHCSELMTDFTRINAIEKKEPSGIDTNVSVESVQEKKISKEGKQFILIGVILIFLQILSYRFSYERFSINNSGSIGYILGRNILFVIGIFLIIKGVNKRK